MRLDLVRSRMCKRCGRTVRLVWFDAHQEVRLVGWRRSFKCLSERGAGWRLGVHRELKGGKGDLCRGTWLLVQEQPDIR